jgi:hypothetical protein
MATRRTIFDLLIGLSLFNLLLLRVWAQLLPAVVNPANLYYMKQAPHWIHYPAVLGTLFASAAVACALAAWARRSPRRWPVPLARAALLLLAMAAAASVWGQLPPELQGSLTARAGPVGGAALALVGLAALAWLLRSRAHLVFGTIEVFAIVGFPFLLMTVGQALFAWVRYDPQTFGGSSFTAGEAAAALPARPAGAPRVVWIIFDELDQRAVFSARPERLALPQLDRLRAESFFATNAYAPARETRRSMASLLLGRQVTWAMPSGSARLPCAIDGASPDEAVSDCWTHHPNLFAKLRDAGVNAGVAAWYHPYCRIFQDTLTRCSWAGLPYWDSPRLLDSLDQQWEEVVKALPVVRLWLRPGPRIRAAHRDAFELIERAALPLAADPSTGFALLHFPVPHHPDIFDPERAALSTRDERSYFDNLVLADRTLGEVRAAMEAADLWNASTVIVTSDHWWRAIHRGDWGLLPEEEAVYAGGRDKRIPFLVKFAGEPDPAVYPKAFNTLLLHDLVLEVFAERLASSADVAVWLDANRSRAPVPYRLAKPPRRAGRRRPAP